jgi:hypothetical protein
VYSDPDEMIIRFTVTRKDTGAGVPNARIEVEKAETVGFTDSQGKAEIVTYWSGNWTYSVTAPGYDKISGTLNNRDIPVLDFSVSLLYAAVPPPPTDPGVNDTGRVGTSCSILGQGTNGNFYYAIRHDRRGMLTSFHKMDWGDARDQAMRMPVCFETPPPPPKTLDEVSDEVTTLQKMLNSTVGTIAGLVQSVTDIKAWISDMILELLLNKLMEGRKRDNS